LIASKTVEGGVQMKWSKSILRYYLYELNKSMVILSHNNAPQN
jgi:hypothetical protein